MLQFLSGKVLKNVDTQSCVLSRLEVLSASLLLLLLVVVLRLSFVLRVALAFVALHCACFMRCEDGPLRLHRPTQTDPKIWQPVLAGKDTRCHCHIL